MFHYVSVLFHPTLLRGYNYVIFGDEMKEAKIAIAAIALAAVATLMIGLAFAHYFNNQNNYPTTRDYTGNVEDQTWWNEMRERMQNRFEGIEDEEWFDDMLAYMEEHWNEIQDQEWFNEMQEYMQENRFNGYYGYGRHGCWGW